MEEETGEPSYQKKTNQKGQTSLTMKQRSFNIKQNIDTQVPATFVIG